MTKATMWLAALAVLVALHGAMADDLAEGSPPWAYKGPVNPSNWEDSYPDCGLDAQSPINIPGPFLGLSLSLPLIGLSINTLPRIAPSISGSCVDTLFSSKGPDYKWTFQAPNTCQAVGSSGANFNLIQVHLHSPSEHTISGVSFDAEVHFVHSNADGSALMVIGVLLKGKNIADNAWLDALFEPLPDVTAPSTVQPAQEIAEPASFIPIGGKWYNYQGSLTTPPCSEIVDWWVSATPVSVSHEQIALLKSKQLLFPQTNEGRNNRPLQARNGRTIRPL